MKTAACIGFALVLGACGATEPPSHAATAESASMIGGDTHADFPVVTGIPECDAYLDLYRRCAPQLAAEIAAGDRRSYEAEAAWLTYMARSSGDPGVPGSCREMSRALRPRCR